MCATMKKPELQDLLTKEGAEALAARLESYWQGQGYPGSAPR
jgi:hypothetical protein